MAALEPAVAGTRLQGFVSGGTVQPDQRTQDEAAALAGLGMICFDGLRLVKFTNDVTACCACKRHVQIFVIDALKLSCHSVEYPCAIWWVSRPVLALSDAVRAGRC